MVLSHVALDWLWHCLPVFSWFFLMLHWIDRTLFIYVLTTFPHVVMDWLWHCLFVFSSLILMLHWIDCEFVYLCSHCSFSCCFGLILTLYICVLKSHSLVELDWLWHCLSMFSWFFLRLHWIDCDIVYLCSHGSFSCCLGLIVALFIWVLIVLSHFALDWLWICLSVFSWFFLRLHWIDCDIFYLCSHGSFSCCLGLIVALFIWVLIVLPHVALDWLWHCLSVFSWFFLRLHWIDCDIVYLCSHGSFSCCLGLIVALFIWVLIVLSHFALDWLWICLSVFSWFFLRLHWIDCDIFYLCSHGSFSCCLGLIVAFFIWVLIVLPHVALDWLWHCLSVFSWFFLRLHWIDCGIVYLCSHGSFSCCLWLIVALFIWVLIVLPHFALDWLWICLSVFSWFFLRLHWIDCDIFYLCSHGSFSCCLGLIVALFIWVLIVIPHVALDWLWICLSVFSWFFLRLHWIDCDIFYLCSHGSFSCCLGLIVALFICVFMVLPHFALDWLWHCYLCSYGFLLMLPWIDCDIVYQCSHGSSSCCLELTVALVSVFSWFLLILHWIDCDIVCLYSRGYSSCCIGLIVTLFSCVLMVLPHFAFD